MSKPEVVVYGASGYTGKLISWHLAEYGIPFIAAGRNQERLEAQMGRVPELAGANYECRAVAHEEAALTALFKGRKVVYNVVGPFMQLGEPVVRAALAAGCHYLDTTGETDWMLHLREKYGAAFAARDLILAPATSWMWMAGQMATELALESPGIDTLDVAYLADSNTSVASTMSFMRMLTKAQHYLLNDKLEVWPAAKAYPISIPGVHPILNSLPWGGGGEPIWYEHDARVHNCSVLVAFRNQAMLDAILGLLVDFEREHGDKPEAQKEQITNEIGNKLVWEEPGREEPHLNRSIISCQGRGDTSSVSVILRGNSPYIQTGVIAAEACDRILKSQHRSVGFTSGGITIGARRLIAANADRGYLSWERTAV
ncbi:MAG: saccharopine dehydrogenase NADP-binding domain-containing protein [Gammaproteobacteria bacterium]|nr:saccharopine dehydrogenase NADP-binding domain-containing protein [Gammaproteobacteria bacterium]